MARPSSRRMLTKERLAEIEELWRDSHAYREVATALEAILAPPVDPALVRLIRKRCPDLPSSLRELGGEALDPPVDAHVIHLDTALSQEFLDVSVRQAEPQVPPDRQRDDLRREAVPGEGRAASWTGVRVSA